MASKVDLFVADKWLPGLYQRFKKEVTLIKVEAEKLHIPYESYHPYYILVYSFIKELMCEDVIVNDNFSRGSFHKIWILAEETDDLGISLKNKNLPLTKYGMAVKNKCTTTSNVFSSNEFQYDRNKKRLNFILESIRHEAKEGGKTEIGLMERVAFFYNTLCYQDPSVTCDMNELWAKLNEDLICKDPTKINTSLQSPCLLPDITRRTFQTNMKCFLCMFGTINYKTEPEFYRHTITTHNSFRINCKGTDVCKEISVNRFRLQQHIMEHHKDQDVTKAMYCKGCGKLHTTLLKLIECEDKCASDPAKFRKLTPYYWEKYYFIWSDVTHGSKIWSYFFDKKNEKDEKPEDVLGTNEAGMLEDVVDESLFDVSFGSDFDDPDNLIITEVKSIATPENQVEAEEKKDGDEKEKEAPTTTSTSFPVPEVVTFTLASAALPSTSGSSTTAVSDVPITSTASSTTTTIITTATTTTPKTLDLKSVVKDTSNVRPASTLTRKRKSNEKEDPAVGNDPENMNVKQKKNNDGQPCRHVSEVKRTMNEHRDYLKTEIARLDSKLDQVLSAVNFIKDFIDR